MKNHFIQCKTFKILSERYFFSVFHPFHLFQILFSNIWRLTVCTLARTCIENDIQTLQIQAHATFRLSTLMSARDECSTLSTSITYIWIGINGAKYTKVRYYVFAFLVAETKKIMKTLACAPILCKFFDYLSKNEY